MHSSARFLAAAALAVAFAAPLTAIAQGAPSAPGAAPAALASPGPGGHRHHRGGAYMRALHALDLSAAQKQQITTAMQQARQTNQNLTDPAARKANRDKLHAQIDAILTPAQRTQLQATMQQQRHMHEQRPDRDSDRPAPSPSAKP